VPEANGLPSITAVFSRDFAPLQKRNGAKSRDVLKPKILAIRAKLAEFNWHDAPSFSQVSSFHAVAQFATA